jgi:hypothetical protein
MWWQAHLLARVTQAATPKQFNLLACVSMASSTKKKMIY